MQVVILAAGFARRLYPLTLTRPKPLLSVAGRPMINYALDHLAPINGIEHVCLATNAKFADQFQKWADEYHARQPRLHFTIINDSSVDDTHRLGAVGDLDFVLSRCDVKDDIIVVAADNLFSESLGGFGSFCVENQFPVLGVYDVGSVEQARKYGVVEVDASGKITGFEEKPALPRSTLIGIALYYYPKRVVPLIHQYIADGNNPDQLGRFVQWLYPRLPVYTWTVPGTWCDIGSKESLEEANRIFATR